MSERTLPVISHFTGEDAISQGTTWLRYISWDYVDPTSGQLRTWDTTGYTARMSIGPSYDQPVALICTTENGRLTTGLGMIGDQQYSLRILIPGGVTAHGTVTGTALEAMGLGVYVINLIDPAGEVTTMRRGNIVMEDSY